MNECFIFILGHRVHTAYILITLLLHIFLIRLILHIYLIKSILDMILLYILPKVIIYFIESYFKLKILLEYISLLFHVIIWFSTYS